MRVVVYGAGIIGLAVAEELLARGHHVQVVDPAPAQGASYAAAGMLTPGGELWHGETDLFRLALASAAMWPAYASRLGVPISPAGTLLVGVDAGDAQRLDRQLALLGAAGVIAEPLTGRELRSREPRLCRAVAGAHLPEDRAVDPREVLAALRRRVPVTAPGTETAAEVVVIATGARLPEPYRTLVRPVRGEILRVRSDDPPRATIRAWVHGEPVYLVPRPARGGRAEVVVGATQTEHDAPAGLPGVEGVARLLAAARELMPGLDRADLVETLARDRPGTADNRPLIGPGRREGDVLAAGHFRHGVLLAPVTARLVADHLETGYVEPSVDPRRFDRTPAVPRPEPRTERTGGEA